MDEFQANFREEMARMLGIDPDLIEIEGVEEGSVKVKFKIKAKKGQPPVVESIERLQALAFWNLDPNPNPNPKSSPGA